MTIIYTLDRSEFVNLFDQYNRADNFTRAAREALFDYYDDLSDDTGAPFEMDVIAICCDWCEYDADELAREYDHLIAVGTFDDEESEFEALLDALRDNTQLIEVDHTDGPRYLVQGF